MYPLFMYNMSTATLRQLRHDFAAVEAAAGRPRVITLQPFEVLTLDAQPGS